MVKLAGSKVYAVVIHKDWFNDLDEEAKKNVKWAEAIELFAAKK